MCRKCFEKKWPSSLSYYDDELGEETLKEDEGIKNIVGGLHQLSLPCCDGKSKIRSSKQEAEHVIDGCMTGLAVVGGVVLGAAALFGLGLAVGLGSKNSRSRRY